MPERSLRATAEPSCMTDGDASRQPGNKSRASDARITHAPTDSTPQAGESVATIGPRPKYGDTS